MALAEREVLQTLSPPEGGGVPSPCRHPPVETPVFGPEAFALNAENGVVTCPGGPQRATKRVLPTTAAEVLSLRGATVGGVRCKPSAAQASTAERAQCHQERLAGGL